MGPKKGAKYYVRLALFPEVVEAKSGVVVREDEGRLQVGEEIELLAEEFLRKLGCTGRPGIYRRTSSPSSRWSFTSPLRFTRVCR